MTINYGFIAIIFTMRAINTFLCPSYRNSYYSVRKLKIWTNSFGKQIFPSILSFCPRCVRALIVPLYFYLNRNNVFFGKQALNKFSSMMDSQKLYLAAERFQLFSFWRDWSVLAFTSIIFIKFLSKNEFFLLSLFKMFRRIATEPFFVNSVRDETEQWQTTFSNIFRFH